MDSKLVREADRHRKLTINQLDRSRISATRFHHHPHHRHPRSQLLALGRQRLSKPHHHQRAITLFDPNDHDDEDVVIKDSLLPDRPADLIPQPASSWSRTTTISLAEVMVKKLPRKTLQDSFEVIGKPINRVIVLSDDDQEVKAERAGFEDDELDLNRSFPRLTSHISKRSADQGRDQLKMVQQDEEEGWEQIGPDGEVVEVDANQDHDQVKKNKSWLDALVLGNPS